MPCIAAAPAMACAAIMSAIDIGGASGWFCRTTSGMHAAGVNAEVCMPRIEFQDSNTKVDGWPMLNKKTRSHQRPLFLRPISPFVLIQVIAHILAKIDLGSIHARRLNTDATERGLEVGRAIGL